MPDARFLDPADDAVQQAWADLLRRSDQATPFSTLAYAEVQRDVLGRPFRVAGILDDDDRLAAGVLVFERRRGPYRLVTVPPVTPYTTFLFDPPLRETDVNQQRSALDALLSLLDDQYHALAFHLHPAVMDVRSFQWAGWNASPFYTQEIDLQAGDDLLGSWSSTTRNIFRNTDGYSVIDDAPAAGIANLVAGSYARHGRTPPLPPSALTAVLDRMRDAEMVRLYGLARSGNSNLEAGIALMTSRRDASYWLAGSEPGPAMTLLIGTLLHRLRDEGLLRFDFVGANTPSIAEFKRKFGPRLVPYYRVVDVRRPELVLLHHLRPVV